MSSQWLPEDVLQLLWYSRKLPLDLCTTQGLPLQIIHPGTWNRDSGPDFAHAQIQMGTIRWWGQVEIHVQASQWYQHKHQFDPAYETVILHVVWEHDAEIEVNKRRVPVLELKRYFSVQEIRAALAFMETGIRVPCQNERDHRALDWSACMDKMGADRLIAKRKEIELECRREQWEPQQVYWWLVCSFFGGYLNKENFKLIGRHLSWVILKRLNPKQIQILLKGVTHQFLENWESTEFQIISKRFPIWQPLLGSWKRGKTRPSNQLKNRAAQWILWTQSWVRNDMEVKALDWKQFQEYLHPLSGIKLSNRVTRSFYELFLINVQLPFLVWQGLDVQEAIAQMETLAPENNRITRLFQFNNNPPCNGLRSQGLYHLWNNYCLDKKCLNCSIGQRLIQKSL